MGSHAHLAAENLFLKKQLALYVEAGEAAAPMMRREPR
jgi:hypothetical protein